MTNPDLAALSEAATWCGKKPLVLECVEGGIWQLRLIFGEGDDACRAMRQWSDEYRAGRLVHIDEGMREATARAEAAEAWPTKALDLIERVTLEWNETYRKTGTDYAQGYSDCAGVLLSELEKLT